jgi:DUF1009 family protein
MEWASVRVPREALDKLAKLRETLARDLCDSEECRRRLMETMTPGKFFNAVLDVFLRGEARDYDTLLKAVMRMYEAAGVDVYIKAKDKLEKKTRGYL